jgi:hypothetical protein
MAASRIDVLKIREELVDCLGENSQKYFDCLSLFFKGKLSKFELDFYTNELYEDPRKSALACSSAANYLALHNLFIRAILCNAYRSPPPTALAPPSAIPYAPAIGSNQEVHGLHAAPTSVVGSGAGTSRRRRHLLIQLGSDEDALQTFKKTCLRNTVLALPAAERLRLRNIDLSTRQNVVQPVPVHRPSSATSLAAPTKKALAPLLKPSGLCRRTASLPSLDSLSDRMLSMAREHSLKEVSHDVVTLVALALHFHMKRIIMNCLSRLRRYCSEPPGETHDSFGYGMMRSSSVLLCHSLDAAHDDPRRPKVASSISIGSRPPITLKDLKMSLELHPHLLCEHLHILEKIRVMSTSETEFDELARQMKERFARACRVDSENADLLRLG